MQPNTRRTKLRTLLGLVTVIAIGAFGYAALAPEQPTVLSATSMAALTNADTFRTVQGDGSQEVHVFISVDCPFCRKVEPELALLRNVTVYRHLLPGHSTEARSSALAVLCASAPAEAWAIVAGGQAVPSARCDGAALDRNYALAKRLGLTVTPSIVFEDGTVGKGALSAAQLEQKLKRQRGA